MVVLLSGPSYSSLGVIFRFPDWSMVLNCVVLFGVNCTLIISRVSVNVICCSPESGSLMSCGVWRICGVTNVVCHGGVCDCVLSVLNGVILSCFYGSCTCPVTL